MHSLASSIILLITSSICPKPIFDSHEFFSLSNAEKILGQQAHLSDSASTVEDGVAIYKCSYTANTKDPQTSAMGNIYFMFEQYEESETAHRVYSSILKANADHEGVKELHQFGDEAHFHSDDENFLFIMVRKGGRILRMKVNKIPSTTSLEEFNLLARDIVEHL